MAKFSAESIRQISRLATNSKNRNREFNWRIREFGPGSSKRGAARARAATATRSTPSSPAPATTTAWCSSGSGFCLPASWPRSSTPCALRLPLRSSPPPEIRVLHGRLRTLGSRCCSSRSSRTIWLDGGRAPKAPIGFGCCLGRLKRC